MVHASLEPATSLCTTCWCTPHGCIVSHIHYAFAWYKLFHVGVSCQQNVFVFWVCLVHIARMQYFTVVSCLTQTPRFGAFDAIHSWMQSFCFRPCLKSWRMCWRCLGGSDVRRSMHGQYCLDRTRWEEWRTKTRFQSISSIQLCHLPTREGQAGLQSISQGGQCIWANNLKSVPNTIHVMQEADQNYGFGPFKTQFLSNLDSIVDGRLMAKGSLCLQPKFMGLPRFGGFDCET